MYLKYIYQNLHYFNIFWYILKRFLPQGIVYLKACQDRKDTEQGFVFTTWLTNVLHVERHFIINNAKRV